MIVEVVVAVVAVVVIRLTVDTLVSEHYEDPGKYTKMPDFNSDKN